MAPTNLHLPGPRSRVAGTFNLAYRPFQAFPAWQRRYGDPFNLPSVLGDMVVTGDPESIHALVTAHPSTFEVYAPDAVKPLAGEHSVSVVDGEPHTRLRKTMMPSFHGAQMRAFGRTLVEIGERYAARWPTGAPFRLYPHTINISMEAMVSVVMALEERAAIERCRDVVTHYVGSYATSIAVAYWLRRDFLGIGPWAAFQRAKRVLDDLIHQEISARRRRGEPGGGILGLLLSTTYDDGTVPTDAEIRDQLATLMFAGHETTGAAMAWAFYWVLSHPAVKAQLLEEIDGLGPDPAPDALAELPFLGAVCHEALRVYPIVPHMFRLLRKPFALKGYELPAGTGIDGNAILLHRHPDLYPNGEQYRPERFLERKISTSEFLPFGGGARRCLGAGFAVYEMRLVLATVLRQYELALVDPAPAAPVRHGLVIAPRGGVPVVVKGRRPARRAARPARSEAAGPSPGSGLEA